METYSQFKTDYLETLKAFLACNAADKPCSTTARKLAQKMEDMEDSKPFWVEEIVDMLCDDELTFLNPTK